MIYILYISVYVLSKYLSICSKYFTFFTLIIMSYEQKISHTHTHSTDEKTNSGKGTFANKCEGLRFHSTYELTSQAAKDSRTLIEDRRLLGQMKYNLLLTVTGGARVSAFLALAPPNLLPTGLCQEGQTVSVPAVNCFIEEEREFREPLIICWKHACPLLQWETLSQSSKTVYYTNILENIILNKVQSVPPS